MGRVVGRILRLILIVIGIVALLVAGALYVLLETQRGHDFLLRYGLDFANERIEGELAVGEVHSAGILRGLTLTDVVITGPEGSEVVRADSVRAGYSLLGFLRGSIIVSPMEVWSPRVVVERLHGEGAFNVERVFAPSGPPTDPPEKEAPPAEERRIAVERVTIHDGELVVRLPVEEGDVPMERAVLEEAFGGGMMQRYAFTAIDGDIPQILIREPNAEGEYFRIRELSLVAAVLDEPFELSDFRGRVERIGTRLTFDADRIWLSNSEFAGEGSLDWGGDDLELELDLDADILHAADFRWIVPDLPAVTGRLSVRSSGLLNEGLWTVSDADLELEGSRIRGSGGVQLGETMRLVDVDVTAAPLAVFELERFLPGPIPVSGLLRGRVQADGPLAALAVEGDLSFEEPGAPRPPSTATFSGLLHAEGSFGATDLSLLLEPFHFGLAGAIAPAIRLRGSGSVAVEATGRIESGVSFSADVAHAPDDLPHSRITARGSVIGDLGAPSGANVVDVEGEIEALSMEMVARYYPDVPLSGIASGRFALNGPLSDLAANARIETPGGPVVADARFDAFDPGAHYRLEASVADFELSGLLAEAPEPTRFSARAFVDGRGFDPASMWASVRLEVGSARVGHLDVDSAATFMRIAAGVLTFDTIMANTSVVDVDGSGTFALADGAPEGEVRLAFLGETLDGLRPFLLGETVIAGDTLTEIERLSVAMEGMNPDDLPDVDELTVTGRLAGDVTVRGGIRNFRTDGTVALEEVVYGEHSLRRANATFFAEGLRTPEWRVVSTLSADTIEVFDRRFAGAFAEGEYSGRDGRGEGQGFLRIQRDAAEDYRVRAAVEVQPDGGVVNLDELTLRFDAVQWNLGAPSIIAWSDDAVTVRDFRLIRPGIDGMRIEADGRIPFDGEIDFRLLVDALNLSRIAQLAQMETEVAGTLSMGVEVTGHTREPIMNGTVFARDVRYDEFALSSIEGELSYLDRRLFGELEAWHGGRQVFTLAGNAPLDLAFRDIERRLLDAPMELRVMVDSFPAANALSFLEDMRNVEGVLAGQLDIGGTPREPSPTGSMRLRGGAATLPALGVRYTEVEANLLLDADGRVLVNAAALSRGTARVEGTVQLDPFSDPSFDLLIVTNNFLAVDRRDMTARMGGEVNLTGRYSLPEIRGDVRVQEATLFLDEFVRTADIIDLTDPSFWNVVDTSVVAAQPIIEAQNPFLQNLQLDVNLVVARDTWLRSREINVEMGGELAVNYNRSRNEMVLSGSLQAIRGAYTQFGRQFQVREGTVDFPGTPGIDPNLNIQAVNRLRTAAGEPLDIIATVQGTLTNLRVQLSSESQPPIAESDLVSYLIFGRPSYALASGEQSILQGTRGAVESLGAGALASQLGSVFAPLLGVDYFAVTQGDQGSEVGANRVTGAFAATQFEVGQYFLDNLFVAFLYRPQANQLPGVRAEWRFSDLWTVESFVEDRFSRSGITGFSELGFQLSKVIGVSIFREWGY